jgi:hypothetical protein
LGSLWNQWSSTRIGALYGSVRVLNSSNQLQNCSLTDKPLEQYFHLLEKTLFTMPNLPNLFSGIVLFSFGELPPVFLCPGPATRRKTTRAFGVQPPSFNPGAANAAPEH